jgi:hypothetical protein
MTKCTINGIAVDCLSSFSIGGYTQVQYMSGYDIPMWHCTCGHFLGQCCTGGSCEHIDEVNTNDRQ